MYMLVVIDIFVLMGVVDVNGGCMVVVCEVVYWIVV